jgi:hypothetical protein
MLFVRSAPLPRRLPSELFELSKNLLLAKPIYLKKNRSLIKIVGFFIG